MKLEIIKESIDENNALESRIPKEIADITPFKIKDYNYLPSFLSEFNQKFDIYKFITYSNVFIWREISEYKQRKSIWYWKGESNEAFLKNQLLTIRDLLDSYLILIKSKNYKSAFILFRTYIELSAQLFASLIDFEFYKKYTKDLLDEDYQNHWFRYLKPEKVLSNLRRINSEFKKEKKEQGFVVLGDLRAITFPFESGVRKILYNDFSNFSHGNYYQISTLEKAKIENYLHMTTDYISTVTSLLKMAMVHYLINDKNVDERKHIITLSIWTKVNYRK